MSVKPAANGASMAVEVILPRVASNAETTRLNRWLVAEGERVREGQPLFEIEADPAASEVEAPASGVLRGLRAKAGDRLPVGATLAWIVGEDEPFDPDLQALAGELRALLAPAAPPPQTDTPGDARARLDEADEPSPALPPAPALVIGAGGRLNRLWLSRGEGAPIVFIHGFGADLNGWRPLVNRMPGAYSALAVDLPGHGASLFAGEATLAALTAAVAATLAEEGVAAAHLVGHSLGGAVAAALTTAPGFRALSLALISPAGLGPEVNGAFIAGFLRARSEASLSPWMRELVADPAALGSALVNTTLSQRAAGGLVEAQARLAEALFPDGAQAIDIRPWLAEIAIPAKVIVGVEDRILPARQAEALNGLIALHRLARVGHMPHLEARAEVARLLTELVRAGG
jgi:pyruvate dehydrogenase E2 component (dihydrolipoamide acetyltransferase)